MNAPLSSVTASILFLMIVGMNFKLNDNIFKNTIKKKGKMLIRYQLFKFYDFNNCNSYSSLIPKEKYQILEMVHLFLIKMLKTMPVCLVILFYYSSNADFYAVGR